MHFSIRLNIGRRHDATSCVETNLPWRFGKGCLSCSSCKNEALAAKKNALHPSSNCFFCATCFSQCICPLFFIILCSNAWGVKSSLHGAQVLAALENVLLALKAMPGGTKTLAKVVCRSWWERGNTKQCGEHLAETIAISHSRTHGHQNHVAYVPKNRYSDYSFVGHLFIDSFAAGPCCQVPFNAPPPTYRVGPSCFEPEMASMGTYSSCEFVSMAEVKPEF